MASSLSDRGVQLIASFEGFLPRPYLDTIAKPPVWTIGFGSTKGVGPNTPPITREQALARLKREVQETYAPAIARLGLPLNQNQFDALVSFVYNLGPGAVGPSSTMGQRLRAHDYKGASAAFMLYVNAGGKRIQGLVNRRAAERRLFDTPAPAATPEQPKPTVPQELKMIDSTVADDSHFYLFEVGPQRKTIWIADQGPNSTNWSGGQAGKQIAKLRKFRDAPKDRTFRGIAAQKGPRGALWLFCGLDDGSIVAVTRPKDSQQWSEGLRAFAPKPF